VIIALFLFVIWLINELTGNKKHKRR
ncbi:hypothetical protein LCGC14_3112720, partial [marine sediment metagenome]